MTKDMHRFGRLAPIGGLLLAAALLGAPEAGAQGFGFEQIPFDTPAVLAVVDNDYHFDVTFGDLAPLVPKSAIAVGTSRGSVRTAQAVAGGRGPLGFFVMVQAFGRAVGGSTPSGDAQAFQDFVTDDPLHRETVKVEFEFLAVADGGVPGDPGSCPHGCFGGVIFTIHLGTLEQGGYLYEAGRQFASMPIVSAGPGTPFPWIAVGGAHASAVGPRGSSSHHDVNLHVNGLQTDSRRFGPGPLVYSRKITMNVRPGSIQHVVIRANATGNGFVFVDPVLRPHPDNPEVVVRVNRMAVDPTPPPLAIATSEELAAAGIDITPLVELGLFDPPAPARVTGTASNSPQTAAYRASLKLDVTGGNSPVGSLRYNYGRRRLNLVSQQIDSLSIVGTTATITGTGAVNGTPGHTFVTTINAGSPDSFGIQIRRPNGSILFSAPSANVKLGDLTISP